MDCEEVRERIAGWLDGELSPGEAELFGRHLARCTGCTAEVERVEEQSFARPPLPDTDREGFWDQLDLAAHRELDRVTAEAAQASAQPPPPWRRELRLGPVQALAAAALLIAALGAATVQTVRAAQAQAALAELQVELDRQDRLAASPGSELPIEPYTVSVHTPFRGSL